jgi:serine/threonine protein kinase
MNMDPSTAGRVVGRYEILRQIGQGAMATVHLARQLDLDRAVALKELDRLAVGDSSPVASRFLREAHVAGSLSHAGIVTVYEYFVHDGRPFIAMEFVEGGSLRRYLPGLTLNQIFGLLEDLLAALDHSGSRGVVHRDIKPENMLVTVDGRVKIADFGIASAYGLVGGALLTATGATVGTPMYMAPEQATGAPTTIATDLYALGIVAFEMLLGQLPFGSAESPIAIIWQHSTGRSRTCRRCDPTSTRGCASGSRDSSRSTPPTDRPRRRKLLTHSRRSPSTYSEVVGDMTHAWSRASQRHGTLRRRRPGRGSVAESRPSA